MVKKKVLPAPDLYASCPNDGKILEYYQGTFDSVFVALHQFCKPNKIQLREFESDDCPKNAEMRNDCKPISWKEVLQELPFDLYSEMDIGLRTYIGGLNSQFENKALSETIRRFSETSNIKIPDEGLVCPFIEEKVLSTLIELGYEWLWVGDEFGTERKLKWIEDILEKDELPYSACSYTPDRKVLIATHWDSHCTFICANNKLLKSIINGADVEGFYCNDQTEVYWGLY
ncbi:DUF2711 family protein [Pseudoalteromonas sp. SS15]|uniref:DUF2711 family protein n=1 Tax=Pseudoalteromonas sp. SS15 TaxID=3139393 RepID=UPI003BA8447D